MLAMYVRIVRRGITRRFRRSAVTCAGVALAVASLVTLEAIMQGVTDAMITNSVALHHGHLNTSWPDGAGVDAAANLEGTLTEARGILPRRRAAGMLVNAKRQVSTLITGVDRHAEAARTVVAGKIIAGDYLTEPGTIVLGAPAAEMLGVSVGQDVEFWRKDSGAARFRVGGLYETGVERLDVQMCFVRRGDLHVGDAEIAVFLSPGADVDAAAARLGATLPAGARVATWRQSLAGVVQLTGLNRVAANVVLALALLILAFGVANTMYISVNDRTHEFGVLKAMGVTPRGIALLVQAETLGLVALAGLAGAALGAGVSGLWSTTGLDLSRWTSANPHFIASGVVTPRLVARSIVLPVLVALACGLLAGALPARRAGRISVVRALRMI